MIEQLKNIQELIFKIISDKKSNNFTQNRFPIRFIFLSSFETLQKTVVEFEKIGINKIELSDYLPKDDGWVFKQDLINELKKLNEDNDNIILPFSEIARFYSNEEFSNLFSQLTEIRNIRNYNRRIYIPLVGIKERFEKEFYEKFSRKNEYSFLWEVNENIKRASIYLYNKPLNFEITKIQTIKSTKGWLTIWEKNLDTPTLCISESLSYLSKNTLPDKIFDFIKLKTVKDIISNIYNLEIPIKYNETETDFWNTLLKKINTKTYNTFQEFVRFELNTNKITVNNFINLWLQSKTDFEKWILKNQLISQDCLKDKYLCKVLNRLSNFNNLSFLKLLWLTIFEEKNIDNKIITDRTELLKQFYEIKNIELPKNIIDKIEKKINSIDNLTNKFKLLIGILPFEKILLFMNGKDNLQLIDEKYPELYNYFSDFDFSNLSENIDWIKEYFKEYQIAKLNNEYPETIKELINTKNRNEESFYKWYHTFKDVNSILSNFRTDEIFWIDAVGIEWISFIEYFLRQKKYNIEDKQIARVNLPTTTDTNRYKNTTYIQDFDQFIHSKPYQYPQTIIEEFERLSKIIDKKINLDKNKRAIIISDHGLSALSRLQDSKKYKFKSEHEGRYAKVDNISSFSDDNNYIKYSNNLIALKHNSLSTKPIREVHGGCTPEEVLVPVIVFSTIDKIKEKDNYKIQLITNEINKKEPIIELVITPKPQTKVYIYYGNLKIEIKNIIKNKYSGKFKDIKTGKQSIKIKIGNSEQFFNINIKSGFTEEDLF